MNANTQTTPAAPVAVLHSTNAATDTARVWVDSSAPDRPALAAARKVAASALHTIVGKPLTVEPAGDGASYVTYGAIRSGRSTAAVVVVDPAPAPAPVKAGKGKGKGKRLPAGVTPDMVTPGDTVDGLIANLQALTPDAIARVVAALTAAPVAAPAPVKADRPVPEFIARAQAVTCRTCRDLGVVRAVGAKAGQPYRTQAGADAATQAGRSVKCPSHTRAGKGKRSA